MEALDRVVRRERPDLPSAYFAIKRAGVLHIGVGSAVDRKLLIRVEGPTLDPDDDVLLEAKRSRVWPASVASKNRRVYRLFASSTAPDNSAA